MKTVIIRTNEELEDWVTEHGWFEDGRVLNIEPTSIGPASPVASDVTIELAYQIEGNYKAHSRRVSRVFRIRAHGIRDYNFPVGASFSTDHCMEGFELLESERNIAFCLDVPANLKIVCESLGIEQLPDLVDTVKPWLSERDLFAKVATHSLPTPEEWVTLFGKEKQVVAWHMYGGEPRNKQDVPPLDYQGWFLQDPAKLDTRHQGIFFFDCESEGDGFRVQIENHGASHSLWHAAKVILGRFESTEIHCGNCEFSGPEWLEELNKFKKTQQDGADADKPHR